MSTKVRVEKTYVEKPAQTILREQYRTTDGKLFEDIYTAEAHQRYIDALVVVEGLPEYDDWYWVTTREEVNAVWLVKSHGKWWDSSNHHYVSLPSWFRVTKAYQDINRLWVIEHEELTRHTLLQLIELMGETSNDDN